MLLAIDPSSGDWRMPEYDGEPLYRFRIEKAKSGRAKCKNCGENLSAGEWRIGTPIKWRTFISAWSHPQCFYCKEGDPVTSNFSKQVFGWNLLQPGEEIKQMEREISKSVPPDHLGGTLNADDLENDEFMKRQRRNDPAQQQRLPAPENMTLTLLPFQEEGHFWMLNQETLPLRGGILADEMGLGKTIQTVALLASSKLQGNDDNDGGPTLIVAPASAVLQWQDEIVRSTVPNTFKVLVYNTARLNKTLLTPQDLLSYDIVLTSYPVLEQEYRQAVNAQKVDCPYCNRKFLQRKLVSHLKYFCGPDAVKTARLEKQEKKREEGTKKAMQTLHIGTTTTTTTTTSMTKRKSSAITPTAIYRELMEDAGRTASSMMVSAAQARAADEKRAVVVEEEEEEELPVKKKPSTKKQVVVVVDSDEDEVVEVVAPPQKRIASQRKTSSTEANQVAATGVWYCAELGLFWRVTPDTWRSLGSASESWTVLPSTDRFTVDLQRKKQVVRLTTNAYYTSKDGGKTFTLAMPADEEKEEKDYSSACFWVAAREQPCDEDGLMYTNHKWLGQVVSRRFGRRDVLGVIVAHRDGDSEGGSLFRVRHCDGDAEDLDEDEVEPAMERIKNTLSLNWLVQKKKPAARKPPAKTSSTPKKKKKKAKRVDSDGEEFEDDVFVVDEDEEDDDDDDEEEDEGEPSRPLPRFVPQTWGLDDAFEGFTAARVAKKKPAPKKKKKPRAKGESSSSEDEDEEVFSAPADKVKPLYAPFGDIVDEDGLDLNRSLLHCIAWKRVIIDEAHKIKERTNSTAKSVFALRGKLREQPQHLECDTAFENFALARNGNSGAEEKLTKKQLQDEWNAMSQLQRDEYSSNTAILFDYCQRWALTGTPLMNRLGDLYSLVRFLRVPPYSYYYCKKDCDCRLLQWSFGYDAKYCQHCGHTPMSHYSYFNKHIMNPVSRNGYVGVGKKAMELLRDDLLGEIMLRRTKAEREQDLNLPPMTVDTVEIGLSESQRDFYESIYKLSKAKFNTFVAKGTVLNNYAHVFQLLSRLRQASDHPYLILGQDAVNATTADVCAICMMNVDDPGNLAIAKCRHTFHRECVEQYIDNFDPDTAPVAAATKKKPAVSKKKKKQADEDDEEPAAAALATCPSCFVPLTLTLRVHQDDTQPAAAAAEEEGEATSNDNLCVICMDCPRNALLLPCGHVHMCYECATSLENKTCPVCREKIDKVVKSSDAGNAARLFGRKSILQGLKLEEFQSSSKLDAIVQEVARVVSTEADPQKIIVFSQFTTFLDLIQWRLQTLHITGVVKFVGSLNVQERRGVLNEFKTNPDVRVILMSLKAGGEGLNLQEASVVLSVDPWWNPSVEMQAFHRAHRIGQTRPVRAVRFVTKQTIEERMMQLQDKKRLIFEACVDGNDASLARLTQEDLQFLFSN